MEKYIYEYLSKNYKIETSSVGNYGIYQRHTDLFYPIPFNGNELLKEVITVFGISKDDAHGYIYHWSKLVCPDCDLTFYWKMADDVLSNIALPIARRIASQTLGLDLVSVQPLSAPPITLLYLDYTYHQETGFEKVKNKIIKFFKNIYKRILVLFKK